MSTGTPGSSSGIRLGGAPSTDSAPRRKAALMGRSPQDTAAGAWNYVLLILAIVGSAFPIYWMFIVSTGTDVYLAKIPPPVLPGSNFAHNIGVVLGRASEEGRSYNNAQFGSSMVNSVIVTVIVTVATLFFCSLAGFAFAKLRFKGRDALMVIVILTLTIPNQLGIVALFIIISKFGWQQQLVAVIVPALVSAFGVFYMRQFIEDSVPDELVESARVDGASTFRVYWNIVLPIIRPGPWRARSAHRCRCVERVPVGTDRPGQRRTPDRGCRAEPIGLGQLCQVPHRAGRLSAGHPAADPLARHRRQADRSGHHGRRDQGLSAGRKPWLGRARRQRTPRCTSVGGSRPGRLPPTLLSGALRVARARAVSRPGPVSPPGPGR